MTSGNFSSTPVHSIIVDRSTRQRRELVNIEELAESINRIGLIHPLVVTEDGVLVAGERRLTAIKMLGWTSVPTQLVTDLTQQELDIIELEENIRRVDITWQDQVAAIAKYHRTRKDMEGDWSQERTAEELGLSRPQISKSLDVAEAIEVGNERVAKADKFSVALGIVQRDKERKASSVLESIPTFIPPELVTDEETGEETYVSKAPVRAVPLINEDFTEWAAAYTGQKFNLIHCDFPYGVDLQRSGQAAVQAQGAYADGEDVYWKLLDALEMGMSNVVADSAHLIFWFSMDFYQQTLARLTAMGWKVNPFPLIWMKSDNTGILPDAKRGPRRIYETAFFASRGDRVLATGPHGQGAVANAFAHPGKDKSIHVSEKPVPMLRHFLRLCCDEYSLVLDPTCGSGNALKAATALGAPTVLGIERDPEFYTRSIEAYFGGNEDEV